MTNSENKPSRRDSDTGKKIQCRLRVMEGKERIESTGDLTFGEIIGEKFSELMKDTHFHVQEAQQIIRRIKRNPH